MALERIISFQKRKSGSLVKNTTFQIIVFNTRVTQWSTHWVEPVFAIGSTHYISKTFGPSCSDRIICLSRLQDLPVLSAHHIMEKHHSLSTSQAKHDTPKLSLLDLPQEIQLLITSHLIYPDALSLKHTNRYFYSFVYTGLHLKIEWLIQRRRLHLDCPSDSKCELGSDVRFCRGSVAWVLPQLLWPQDVETNNVCSLLMKRRREHQECDTKPGGRGCLVLGRNICIDKKESNHFKVVWRYFKSGVPLWLVVVTVALLAIVIASPRTSPIIGSHWHKKGGCH